MKNFLKSPYTKKEEFIFGKIFNTFVKKEGYLDFVELITGISILLNGSEEEIMLTVFGIYDFEEKGLLFRRDILEYFTTIYKIVKRFEGTQHEPIYMSNLVTNNIFKNRKTLTIKEIIMFIFPKYHTLS